LLDLSDQFRLATSLIKTMIFYLFIPYVKELFGSRYPFG
jgi:hypothetical protein